MQNSQTLTYNEIPDNDNPAVAANAQSIAFTGSGSEFFGIWIVNILLTAITLGIYAAWAKVRTQKYFYNNTLLMNSGFDYTADPATILKGYIIAAVIFIAVYGVMFVFPPFAVVVAIAMILIAPWIIVKSLAFNAKHSVYRGIRFKFNEDFGGAFGTFVGWPLLSGITLGILGPMAVQRQHRFIVNNHSYGQSPFTFHAGVGGYYYIVLMFLLIMATLLIPVALMSIAPLMADRAVARIEDLSPVILVTAVLMAAIYLYALAYVQAAMVNLVWSNIRNGSSSFSASLKAGKLAWIIFSNLLLLAITLGLYYPWAKVRMLRYKLNQTAFTAGENMDHVVAAEHKKQSALGEGMGEMFDIDVGF